MPPFVRHARARARACASSRTARRLRRIRHVPLATLAALSLAGSLARPLAAQGRRRLPPADTTAPARAATSPVVADSSAPVARLVAALLGDTPLLGDLEYLTDRIGGRATGSPANLRSVDWTLQRFREAGIDVRRESFTMPGLWLERSARARVQGAGVDFAPRVAAMPFSIATPPAGVTAPLVDAGTGSDSALSALGARARGAFLLVEQEELRDVDGLFKEYNESARIEGRLDALGAAGVVYMGSRPNDLLYRHNVAAGPRNKRPMLVMDRDGAGRALRLLRAGVPLTLTETIELDSGPAYQSANVVGEIRGASRPDEIVVLGAHLDSWDLGTGALDNGANAMLVLDVARQMRRLGLRPARTVRFVLWNGEEQGMLGSAGYVRAHRAELDRHYATVTLDIGCGRVNGFFTGARPALLPIVARALAPVAGLGPFAQLDVPIVGTDNFDFMLAGVANLVANQESASYGPNYHARSDEFDKCDPRQLRTNAAVAAAVTWSLAQDATPLPRQSRAQVEALMRTTDLADQMKAFGLWEDWASGARGLSK